ncbi:MAG: hypothetical protein LUQ31_10935 [Methanoregula sp.]|nr:hypothetical protein [Methanoregula sp.]
MIADEDYTESIKAFAPFRFVIAAIKIQFRVARCLVAALMEIWKLRLIPQISVQDQYYECRGSHGYSDQVIPHLFDLSPFFSDPF